MMTRNITIPELGLIAATRAIAGVGIGLLIADHMKPEHKRTVGWTLLAVGVLSTIPLAADVIFGSGSCCSTNEGTRESSREAEMAS